MVLKCDFTVGDLVHRDGLMMLVVEIGDCYQEGFVLCRTVRSNPKEYWIMSCLLKHWI